jgi:hypothetical protein
MCCCFHRSLCCSSWLSLLLLLLLLLMMMMSCYLVGLAIQSVDLHERQPVTFMRQQLKFKPGVSKRTYGS